MNKNERLIQQMIYINARKQFNLSDLIETFHISRSTALRDISSLEELGVPLYSEKGSHGGYRVLANQLLPPIYFSNNEWQSIFFSLQVLKGLLKTPFQHNYLEIQQKLLAVLPARQKEQVQQAGQAIQWTGLNQQKEAPLIAELFAAIIQQQVIEIEYNRYRANQRIIQPLRLSIWDGYWYCFSWDINKQEFRNFRCDYIQALHLTNQPAMTWTEEEMNTRVQKQFEQQRPWSLRVKVNEQGIEQFYQKSYENMSLLQTDTETYIVGTFGENELPFLVKYFLAFGQDIQIISPPILRTHYQQYVKSLLTQYD